MERATEHGRSLHPGSSRRALAMSALARAALAAAAVLLALGALAADPTQARAQEGEEGRGGRACDALGAAVPGGGLGCNLARDAADPGGEEEGSGADESTATGSGSDEDGSGSGEDAGEDSSSGSDSSSSDEGQGGFIGMMVDGTFGVLGALWDSSGGDLGEKMTEDMGKALLFMPDPTDGDQETALSSIYDDVQKLLAPAMLLALLVVCLLKIVSSYNIGGQSFSLSKIGHITGVMLAIAALPLIFATLSTLSMGLTAALLPEGGDMAGAMLNVLNPLDGLFAVSGILTLILALMALWVGGKVIIIAIIKIITWPLLFIGGIFILTAALLPGCKHFADNWAKMVMLIALLPAVWALELWLAAKLIANPQAIFGPAANLGGIIDPGLFSSVIAIGVLWVISQTPSKMMALAFQGYHPGMSTGIRSAGRWVASAVVMQGTGMALRAATGAVAGGAAGAAAGGAASKGESYSFNQSIRDNYSKSPGGGWVHQGRSMSETYNAGSGQMSAQEMADYLQNRISQTGQNHNATDTSRSPNNYPQPPRDEPRAGLRAETPGLPGSGSQEDADSGLRQSQTGGNPGSTRVVRPIPYEDGEQRREPPRHPDAGQDPGDSAMFKDGDRWRWRK